MEVSNNYTIQPGFKASFVTHNVAQNHARWNRIGKMFQEATKEMPNDKLILGYTTKDVRPFFYFTLDSSENRPDMVGIQDLGDWILSKSNKEIAEKLVKLFKGMKLKHGAMSEYRKTHTNETLDNNRRAHSLKVIENYYADRMLVEHKDDVEILKIFGAEHILDKHGLISSFRENYANCKNCW
jgi:hypothetical protein